MNMDKDILDKRALQLAMTVKAEVDSDTCLKIVEFRLGEEIYGIELQYIHEVYPLQNLTKLPGLPSYIKGVINVRGRVVSVLELKDIFQLNADDSNQTRKVIILRSAEMEFGIAVDMIMGVRAAREDRLTLSLPTLKGSRSDYLKGITENHLIILDGRKLLNDPKLVVDYKD